MNVKEQYQKFKQWQRNPFHYRNNQPTMVRCANCGEEFSSNYCPMCGQKADVGRVSWKTARHSVAALWGMESRSFFYTLMQLLLRPGYLISDYISGRRQVSFPPVKMLFIVAIIDAFLSHLYGRSGVTENPSDFIELFKNWAYQNPGWGSLCISVFIIPPTLIIFRYAPRNSRHTLPEGFFVQVYMAIITMMSTWLILLFLSNWVALIIVFYYLVAYQQLFGYSFWGTLWRTVACLFVAIFLFDSFLFIGNLFMTGNALPASEEFVVEPAVLVAIAIIAVLITHFINKKSEKKRLLRRSRQEIEEP